MKAIGVGVTIVAALLLGLPLAADLKQVQAEPNLEKRSKLAMDHAAAALKAARAAYDKGDLDRTRSLIAETAESVHLAEASLKATGKDPRRSPKWFKRAELDTRELARRIEAFRQEMNYADRPMLDKLQAQTLKVHEELLTGLMEGRRK